MTTADRRTDGQTRSQTGGRTDTCTHLVMLICPNPARLIEAKPKVAETLSMLVRFSPHALLSRVRVRVCACMSVWVCACVYSTSASADAYLCGHTNPHTHRDTLTHIHTHTHINTHLLLSLSRPRCRQLLGHLEGRLRCRRCLRLLVAEVRLEVLGRAPKFLHLHVGAVCACVCVCVRSCARECICVYVYVYLCV